MKVAPITKAPLHIGEHMPEVKRKARPHRLNGILIPNEKITTFATTLRPR